MEKLISALKRNQRRDFMLAYFEEKNCEECIKEIESQKAVTVALIDRAFAHLDSDTSESNEEETADDNTGSDTITEEIVDNELIETEAALQKAIGKGKKKKAKKLFKELEALGLGGSEMDKYKAQIKEL